MKISPADGKLLTKFQDQMKDVDLAVEAAKKVLKSLRHICNSKKCFIKQNCRYIVEANLETLAVAETLDNGKAVRETLNADLLCLLTIFRYFASVIRAESGTILI